ncbi:unnamed protein product [Clavelina lepadiformis]|uniref:G-protein coupled receptors family 1 profile domain-containing protein n=1 Tax=Clavelina lepadiformis TaxID=159417 RepID=A0ABP0F418_CLALP
MENSSFPSNATSGQFVLPFTESDVIITSVFLVTFMVFGIFMNSVTLVVIMTSRTLLKCIFNYFILSLCVSDTISAAVSWINLYRRTWGFEYFYLSEFVCEFYWGVDIWTSYVTSLHILSFAVLRLIAITRPNTMKRIKPRVVKVWIILMWIIGFTCGALPMGMFSGVERKDRTSSAPENKWPSCAQEKKWLDAYHVYTIIVYSIFFYIPLVSTLSVSIVIGCAIIKQRRTIKVHLSSISAGNRRSKEKHAMLQLSLIITSFLVGYVPFTAFEFYSYGHYNHGPVAIRSDWQFGTAQYICLRFSECLNPIFYNLGSAKMREATKSFCFRIMNIRHKKTREVLTGSVTGSVISVPGSRRSFCTTTRMTHRSDEVKTFDEKTIS